MDKTATISAQLLKAIGDGHSDTAIRAGFDKVFGDGAFLKLAGELYDELNKGIKP